MKKSILLYIIIIIINMLPAYSQLIWEQTGGPEGGYISKLVEDNDGNIYSITFSSVYKGYFSKVKGLSWSQVSVSDISISNIYVDINNNFFATTNYDNNNKNKVFISTDNMNTWIEKSKGLEGRAIYNLVIRDNGDIMAITENGIYKSTDLGTNWEHVFNSENSKFFNFLCYTTDGTIFGANYQGIFQSSDDGLSWQVVDDGQGTLKTTIVNMGIDSLDNIYVNIPTGIYKSTDKGKNWKHLTNGIAANSYNTMKVLNSGVILISNSIDSYCSIDLGENWNKLSKLSCNDFIITKDLKYILATQSGIQYSEQIAGPWSTKNTGINEITVTCLNSSVNTNDSENVIAGNGNGAIFQSSDSGNKWNYVYKTSGATVTSVISGKDGSFYCSSMWGGIDKSSDGGQTWENKSNGINDPDISCIFEDNEGNLFAGSFSVLYKSTDKGNTWSVCFQQSQSIQCESLIANNKNVMFLGTWAFGAIKSADGGNNWTQINNGISIPLITLSVDKHDNLFGITNTGVLYGSSSDGQSWTIVNDQLKFYKFYPISDNYYLALIIVNNQYVGIYSSNDQGKSWDKQMTGLENLSVNTLFINSKEKIYAGTNKGVFKTFLSTTDIPDNDIQKVDFSINPNPSENQLTINSKSLFKEKSIQILNLEGNILKNYLVTNDLQQKIDITDLSSGVYYVKIGSKISKFIKIKS